LIRISRGSLGSLRNRRRALTNLTATGWLASFYDELTERWGHESRDVFKASASRPVEREDGTFDIALIVGKELTSKGAEAYASGLHRQLEKLLPELKAVYDHKINLRLTGTTKPDSGPVIHLRHKEVRRSPLPCHGYIARLRGAYEMGRGDAMTTVGPQQATDQSSER